MREIKFRAWDKKDKKMYHNIQKGIEFSDLSHYKFDEFLGNSRGIVGYHEWEVMQFTGLKDKNGKDIYEGDIVRILYTNWISKSVDDSRTLQEYKNDISEIGVVKYSYDSFKLEIKNDFRTLYEGDHGEKEVINNIYENPDLTH